MCVVYNVIFNGDFLSCLNDVILIFYVKGENIYVFNRLYFRFILNF